MARRLVVHLVDYDRDEATGEENPRTSNPVAVRLNLPQGARIKGIRFATPEHPDPQTLTFDVESGQVRFRTPGFLVYGVATVEY
jgi:hypothetical protein